MKLRGKLIIFGLNIYRKMDDQVLNINTVEHCRTCLQNNSVMCNIFSENRWEMLKTSCRLEVERNDGLPENICECCDDQLFKTYQFISNCQLADKRLRLTITSRKNKEDQPSTKHFEESSETFYIKDVKFEVPDNSDDFDDTEFNFHVDVKNENDVEESSLNHNVVKKHERKKANKDKKKKADKHRFKKLNSYDKNNSAIVKDENVKVEVTELILTSKRKSNKKDEEFPRKCTECSLILKTRSNMVLHMVTHSDENPFQCDHCGKCVRSKGTLKAHIIRFHLEDGIRRYECRECKKRFYRKTDLAVHLRIHNGETPYSCSYCSRNFVQSSSLLRHIRTHTGYKPYICDQCSKAFCTSNELEKHKIKHSDERRHKCNICGQFYKTKDSLKDHKLIHSNPKGNVCHQCGASFTNRGNLITHIKRVHSVKAGMCHLCNKEFSNIEDHIRTHTGETPFQCNICNMKYSLKQSLRIHMRKHSDPCKFACQYEGCTKTFKLKFMLDFHVNKFHMKQPTYVCKHCNRGFFRLSDIRRHTDMSHADKEFISTDDIRKSKLY